MRTRLEKVRMLRAAESRRASGSFAEAATRVFVTENLCDRLDSAAATLALTPGEASGAAIAGQLELAERMRTARRAAQANADIAIEARTDAAAARMVARRALDAVTDLQREEARVEAGRLEARAVPQPAKDRI